MTLKQCGTCRHGSSAGPTTVACHRYPPTVTKAEGNEVTTYFPLLNAISWCSEWKVLLGPKRTKPYPEESTQ